MFRFKIKEEHGKARLGAIITKHGSFKTPAFIPVATSATVRGLDNRDIKEITDVVLANTYHLHLRPGDDIIKKQGGLHKFMGWDKPIVTDSGGFQAFSLGLAVEHRVGKMADNYLDFSNKKHQIRLEQEKKFAKVDDNGVVFKDPIDGSRHKLTAESSMKIQSNLGADIIFAFDECTSPLSDKEYTTKALKRTHRWALKCLECYDKRQALFGIVQGGMYKDLRVKAAEFIGKLDFDGFGIGGSLGKSKTDMHQILEWSLPILPEQKPRHLLGIGGVEDLFNSVERGIDMFDCVAPTRWARRGHVYISPESGGKPKNKFRFNIENKRYENDSRPIDKNCSCYACQNHSRAYLRHLFKASELTYFRLASVHNLSFILNLMKDIRQSIEEKRFQKLKKKWLIC